MHQSTLLTTSRSVFGALWYAVVRVGDFFLSAVGFCTSALCGCVWMCVALPRPLFLLAWCTCCLRCLPCQGGPNGRRRSMSMQQSRKRQPRKFVKSLTAAVFVWFPPSQTAVTCLLVDSPVSGVGGVGDVFFLCVCIDRLVVAY